MKENVLSKYNHFKTIGHTVVGVNLQQQILFAIDDDKYKLLLDNEDDIDELKTVNTPFYNAMWKLGVIRDANTDNEFYRNALLARRLLVFRDPSFRLTINPTLNCNFSCWYCYETHTTQHMKNEVLNNVMKFIENQVKRHDITTFELDWFGGEPLLCYENVIKTISSFANEVCKKENVRLISGITTNGYLISSKMLPFFKEVNMQSFQITLDGQKTLHDTIRYTKDKQGSYDKIVENITLLARELNPQFLTLRINYTSESFEDIFEIASSFPEDVRPKIKVLLQQVWQDKESNRITAGNVENLKTQFENAGFQVEKEIFNCSGRNTCYADLLNQAVINYDGRVFKCTAINFAKETEDGVLNDEGNILWGHSLAKKIATTTFENAHCADCKYLPICFGPCSKKTSFLIDGDDFRKYCHKEGIEESLDYVMSEFEKTDKSITSLLEYR